MKVAIENGDKVAKVKPKAVANEVYPVAINDASRGRSRGVGKGIVFDDVGIVVAVAGDCQVADAVIKEAVTSYLLICAFAVADALF
ncbi:hypothetical protein AK812_SmicGene24667 [Symbiodinium microadriaticum]|uniref:Uncharacterized protein n=1 Tax=Symbiodinium microadriaticum TaxID=2951 RepID=A0A1Q9DED9_SYMMI|nr:hypothetical protein AK812_SmicGene24667 [Symbiodinium microadriaticum]